MLFLKKSEVSSVEEDLLDAGNQLESLIKALDINSYLELDLNFSKQLFENLQFLNKQQSNFWNNFFLNSDSDIQNLTIKSSSSVQAEITKTLAFLRSRCSNSSSIKLPDSIKSPSFDAFGSGAVPEKLFSFGFSSYDGYWPNFTKDEIFQIHQQSIIIKKIVEFVIDSSTDENHIELLSIKRSSTGAIDSQNIGDDVISEFPDHMQFSTNDSVSGYPFIVQFIGTTPNARTFINLLRSPFILSNFEVNRESDLVERSFSNFSSEFEVTEEKDSNILPIIRDVRSRFTFYIEYITSVSNDLKEFLKSDSTLSDSNSINLIDTL